MKKLVIASIALTFSASIAMGQSSTTQTPNKIDKTNIKAAPKPVAVKSAIATQKPTAVSNKKKPIIRKEETEKGSK